MEAINPYLTVLFGTVLRLGLPILLTGVLIFLLSRLDKSWTSQALHDGAVPASAFARNIGCWDINNCTQEQKEHCEAFAHPEVPCWQHFRSSSGDLRDGCLGCEIFRKAPIPVAA